MYSLKSSGILITLSSPSGAGKSSLARSLVASDDNITISVSCTTRARRSKEIEGEDYFFINESSFIEKIEKGDFIEYARVFGNYYGTLKSSIYKSLDQDLDIIFDVDWQGARALKEFMPRNVVSIYILPPSMLELRNRLINRNQDDVSIIEARMQGSKDEISHVYQYDYVIVNDDFDNSLEKLKTIISAERMKISRQSNIEYYINSLIKEID